MALRFFHIPSHGDAALEAALNQVLSTFRIIKVDRNATHQPTKVASTLRRAVRSEAFGKIPGGRHMECAYRNWSNAAVVDLVRDTFRSSKSYRMKRGVGWDHCPVHTTDRDIGPNLLLGGNKCHPRATHVPTKVAGKLRRAVRSEAFAKTPGGRHMECVYYFDLCRLCL